MYVPKAFEVTDLATLHAFIEANSFATLVTSVEGEPVATRLPLILDSEAGPRGTLIGHMARANPHWTSFDGKFASLAIFDGPHAYISPRWYVTSPAVPTWNYATVHVYGVPRVIDDSNKVEEIVERLVTIYEASLEKPWSTAEVPRDFKAKLLKAIVGFEMSVDRIEGKFKFGQNRPVEDQAATISELEKTPAGSTLAGLARRHLHRTQ